MGVSKSTPINCKYKVFCWTRVAHLGYLSVASVTLTCILSLGYWTGYKDYLSDYLKNKNTFPKYLNNNVNTLMSDNKYSNMDTNTPKYCIQIQLPQHCSVMLCEGCFVSEVHLIQTCLYSDKEALKIFEDNGIIPVKRKCGWCG